MAEKVGVSTGGKTKADRPVYKTPEGEMVSEKSLTIPMGGKFINVPSIHDGVQYSEDEIIDMLKENKIEATSVHDSMEEAIEAAKSRSSKLLAKGGSMESQMDIFEEGGLKDEGGTVDPVSGNDVPPGSTQEEVRDDIPAQLSEGEFVFPADVVRYIGLENLMELRQKAKMGLQKMEDMGQMGNSEEATINDDGAFEDTIDKTIEAIPMAMGGMVPNTMKPKRSPFKRPAQKFQIGGMPQPVSPIAAPIVPPKVPTYAQFMGQSPAGQGPASPVVYGTDQYIGPNGDIIGITTINGQPIKDIPAGYKKYNPATDTPAAPAIAKPEVVQGQGDSSDDRERQEAERDRYKDALTEINTLSELSPDFKSWAEENIPGQYKAANTMQVDPKTGEISFPGMSFGEQFKGALGGEKFKELAEGLKGLTGENAYEKAYAEIADVYGLNIEDYQTKGLFGTTRLDSRSLQRDAMITNAVAKAVPGLKRENIKDIIARTEFERDGDGGIDPDSLVDKKTGNLTKTGLDLFNIESEDDDPANIGRGFNAVGDAGLADGSAGVTGDPAGRSMGPSYSGPAEADQVGDSYSESQQKAEEAQEDDSAGLGGYSKGGAVKTKRKKGLGRLK